MTHGRPASSILIALLLLIRSVPGAAQQAAPVNVEALLGALRQSGVDVIYSSELVTPQLTATPAGVSAMERARAALAANGLALRQLGPKTYVVVRQSVAPPAATPETDIEEVTVYASRYAIDVGLGEVQELALRDIERVPGTHDDALRSLKSLPGVVSAASARPYIRGSLSEDVLVRYDGIPLLDPFHLKNFQSLLSAIDPAAIERIEVFSGGFPVRYGTRSGGVIDIVAPTPRSGQEHRANLSFISAGASTRGRAENMPLDWLVAFRRSTLDMLEPVEENLGTPRFSDSLGRLRWSGERGAWTLGWLLLDDRLRLGIEQDDETARARYRDEYVWLARDHRFNDALSMRSSLVITSAERNRDGLLVRPGVVSGELEERRSFNGLEFSSDWSWAAGDHSSYNFGGGFAATRAAYHYRRHSEFAPDIAALFGRGTQEDLLLETQPKVVTYSLYAANRRQWSRFEAEFGLRADAQHYENFGNHTQVSPRLNLRYDLSKDARVYASIGRFTQAQHVEEWRVEEAQDAPDAAQVSLHSILGLEYHFGSSRLGLEAYSKRWTTTAAYIDNQLDPFALVPELTPDRIRLRPVASEASGLELSLHTDLSSELSTWSTMTWARVADDFPGSSDVLRSWDQPLSLSAGLAWQGSRATLSALVGWHSGWPRTPLTLSPLALGRRNTARTGDFLSLDLHGSYAWQLGSGDLSLVLDVTNATDRTNPCCIILTRDEGPLSVDRGNWLPTIVNLGLSYRWN